MQAWECWQGVNTQWRVGMDGPTGLDYAGVRAYLDEQDIEGGPEARRSVWRGIQAAERATLEVWSDRRDRQAAAKQGPRPPAPPHGL